MRTRLCLLAVSLLLALPFAAPVTAQDGGSPTPDAPSASLPETCREAVTRMAALTDGLQTPQHLMQEYAATTANDFDVSAYFTALDHLTMQPGYVLDYVYAYEFLGGRPFLYAQRADQTPFATFADYARATPDTRYLDYVVPDGSPESYIQWAVLDVMAEQFYLVWHANYNDYRILCDSSDVEAIVNAGNEFGMLMTDEIKAQARALDVTPVIVDEDDRVEVDIVVFTNWGGFVRLTYTVSWDLPRTQFEITAETLVAYDCGIMF